MALFLMVAGLLPVAGAQAQSGAPAIRSFSVDQVPVLAPGTELIFRASGSTGGNLQLDIDGVANQLGLSEVSVGTYAGAYTISIRDKIPFDANVKATLKLGARQSTMDLGQTLLTDAAYATALAAAYPAPQISRIESRTTGALSGGHEITFVVDGSAGAVASVSLDGGLTVIALMEERRGRYSGRYTIKSRDQFSDATQAMVTLTLADKTTRAAKSLLSGAIVPVALVEAPVCEACGVVVSVNAVKIKGKPNYLGAIAGGVAGAALGTQVGKGDGKTAATVLGALGGAVAGREVEKQVRGGTRYDLAVKLDNGTTRTIVYEADPGFKVGDKVRLDGDLVQVRE